MSAVAALLDLFPNKSDLARDIGLKSPTHVGTMKVRMQINPFLWPAIVESARKRKVKGISIRALHTAHQTDAPLREALKASRASVSAHGAPEPARATA